MQKIPSINFAIDKNANEANERSGRKSCHEEDDISELDGSFCVVLQRDVDGVILLEEEVKEEEMRVGKEGRKEQKEGGRGLTGVLYNSSSGGRRTRPSGGRVGIDFR
jgi:hypothetical protein